MTTSSDAQALIEAAFASKDDQIAQLSERLDNVQAMFAPEDQNWTKLFGGLTEDFPGLSLEQVQDWHAQISEYVVGNPIIKRGVALRHSYIWSKGLNIPGVGSEGKTQAAQERRGRKSKLEAFYGHRNTQAYLTSPEAFNEMETSAATQGVYMLVGDDSSKRILHPITIDEISAILTNPDYKGEVWAYLRVWDAVKPDGTTEPREEWIYTDRFEGVREKSILSGGNKRIKVAQNKTVFDQTFNSQVGWPLGVPDALAAIVWARIYSELMNHGKVMTESLAKFAFKVTQNTKKGADNVGVKMSRGGTGQTAVIGAGNDLQAVSSAGKAYDFNGIRAVAAQVATALEVSIVHLLSDPGAAGSSYGSASNLDLPTKRAMVSRQNIWVSFLKRVFEWATGEDLNITFPPLDDDPYRALQGLALIWNTGLISADEMRGPILEAGGITPIHDKAPDGVLLPNNRDSWERSDIDPKDDPNSVPPTAASPNQGQNLGVSQTSTDKNDLRNDTIGEMLKQFQDEAFLDRLEEIARRIESATGQK